MSALSRLSEHLLLHLYNDWLKAADLVTLHLVLNKSEARTLFDDILGNPGFNNSSFREFLLSDSFLEENIIPALQWIEKRVGNSPNVGFNASVNLNSNHVLLLKELRRHQITKFFFIKTISMENLCDSARIRDGSLINELVRWFPQVTSLKIESGYPLVKVQMNALKRAILRLPISSLEFSCKIPSPPLWYDDLMHGVGHKLVKLVLFHVKTSDLANIILPPCTVLRHLEIEEVDDDIPSVHVVFAALTDKQHLETLIIRGCCCLDSPTLDAECFINWSSRSLTELWLEYNCESNTIHALFGKYRASLQKVVFNNFEWTIEYEKSVAFGVFFNLCHDLPLIDEGNEFVDMVHCLPPIRSLFVSINCNSIDPKDLCTTITNNSAHLTELRYLQVILECNCIERTMGFSYLFSNLKSFVLSAPDSGSNSSTRSPRLDVVLDNLASSAPRLEVVKILEAEDIIISTVTLDMLISKLRQMIHLELDCEVECQVAFMHALQMASVNSGRIFRYVCINTTMQIGPIMHSLQLGLKIHRIKCGDILLGLEGVLLDEDHVTTRYDWC
ncbi:hypothetical protein EON65_10145 [archaeon]|nr:MAG: hypothetical protein EON65_10145 [archaeon]